MKFATRQQCLFCKAHSYPRIRSAAQFSQKLQFDTCLTANKNGDASSFTNTIFLILFTGTLKAAFRSVSGPVIVFVLHSAIQVPFSYVDIFQR